MLSIAILTSSAPSRGFQKQWRVSQPSVAAKGAYIVAGSDENPDVILVASDDILNYIANNIKSNIRELEGALNKLLAYSNLEKTDITMDIAKKELQNIITPDKPREITPQLIIEVVSEHFQISLDQMISKNRSNEIAKPRQIAMYLCKTMTDIPLDSILICFCNFPNIRCPTFPI